MSVESLIEHVSDTAFWVATYRADEGKRNDALFSDPLAERLVEGRGRAIAASMSAGAITGWTVAIRTHIIDEYVLGAVADGIDTVLNLGAGLDTRPYRMELPRSLRWIEADFPGVVDYKDAKLAGEAPRCALERRRVDLSDSAARRALLADVDASSRRILVITEGVLPYLSNDQASDLARDLQRTQHVERWVIEYFGRDAVGLRKLLMRRRQRQLARAPFLFSVPDWHDFFGARGWYARDLRYIASEAERLRRPAPLPRWLRLALSILPSSVRKRGQRYFGYALLTRRGAP